MKKIVLIASLFSIPALADWNWLVSVFKKEIKTLEYTIDTSGKNPRVYEFNTQGIPRMHCVVLFRPDTRTSPAMQCVRITKQEDQAFKKQLEK